jgi:hypothetical protein
MRNLHDFVKRWGLSLRALSILSLVCLFSFATEAVIAVKLSSTGAFDYYDVFYDADASKGLEVRAHGWAQDHAQVVRIPNYVHPLNNYITMPIIRIAAMPISHMTSKWNSIQIREGIALLVSPVCVAAAASIVGVALIWLGLPLGAAVLGSVFYAGSFSSLTFGAVPDHFSMAGLSIVMLLAWLAFWISKSRHISRAGYIAWGLIAIFATGVTITNIFVGFVVLALAMMRQWGRIGGLSRAALASGVVVTGVVLCAAVLGHLVTTLGLGASNVGTDPAFLVRMVKTYSVFDFQTIISKAVEFGMHSVQAIGDFGIQRAPTFSDDQPDTIAPLSGYAWSSLHIALGAAFACLFGLGAYVGLRRPASEAIEIFARACVVILFANLLLHSVYGRVAFLYSQHWLFPLVFFGVLALVHITRNWGRTMQRAFAIALVAGVINLNLYWVGQTVSMANQIVTDYRHKLGNS